VNRADLFGLSQLYQLRGRVGRGDRRATCILLTPEETTAEARKRLRVIVENQSLGSGFQVAAADLELRGGGNLVGSAQSGNIDEIGYETWVELLGEAVHAARGDLERERIDPEIEMPVPAFIPDDLVKDTTERMTWYNRIGHARTEAEIERRLDELEGEVGDLPEQVRNLGDLVAVRIACRELGILRCAWHKVRVNLELHESSPLHGKRLADVVALHPKRFEVKGGKISVRFTPAEGDKPFRYLRWVFAQFRHTAG
jgi:transcription-repair coupling factor (superfamily II helicase)